MKKAEIEKIYKTLTRKRFGEIMDNMTVMNRALSNVALLMEQKGKGRLCIPLNKNPDKTFSFVVMQDPATKDEMLVVQRIEETKVTH